MQLPLAQTFKSQERSLERPQLKRKGEIMGKLTVEDILTSVDVQEQIVKVPQWKDANGEDGEVTIRPFTKEAQQALRKECMADGEVNTELFEMALFKQGVVDPVFDDEQIIRLKQKSAAAIDLVLKQIVAASGFTDKEAKDIGA